MSWETAKKLFIIPWLFPICLIVLLVLGLIIVLDEIICGKQERPSFRRMPGDHGEMPYGENEE